MRSGSLKELEAKYREYFSIGEAISTLLHPYGEVVLHDAASGRIVRLWNSFSNRKAGDLSHLESAPDLFTDDRILGPYEKALPSQGRTKSITAVLRDKADAVMGYFCVNLDVTIIDGTVAKLLAFVQTSAERPQPLYLNDFQEQINYAVRDYLVSINKTMDALSRAERVRLVAQIEAKGLFQARNAMRYVANTLGISRASVYNHLAEAKALSEVPKPGVASKNESGRMKAPTAAKTRDGGEADAPKKARAKRN